MQNKNPDQKELNNMAMSQINERATNIAEQKTFPPANLPEVKTAPIVPSPAPIIQPTPPTIVQPIKIISAKVQPPKPEMKKPEIKMEAKKEEKIIPPRVEPKKEILPKEKKSSMGQAISITIVILVIIIGGLYFWGKQIAENEKLLAPNTEQNIADSPQI